MLKSSAIALAVCALAAMAAAVPGHADESGLLANLRSRSRVSVSAGYHRTSIIGGEGGSTGGIELEATGALRLGGDLYAEAGYMSWTMDGVVKDDLSMPDTKRSGLAASLIYHHKSGYELGFGVIPGGGRILLRQTFNKDTGKGFFIQENIAKTNVDTDVVNGDFFFGLAGGYMF